MSAFVSRGHFIVIEGIDGSGKSTIARNLSSLLEQKGYETVLTKEPGDSPLGQKIRELVQTPQIPIDPTAEFLLFAADRAQHFSEIIIPSLEQKKIIISDRLSDSSLAYQGYGRGLDVIRINSINQWVMNSITPDITFFIRVCVETALKRVNKRNEALSTFEKKNFLEKVAHGFETIYKNKNNVIIVDGEQDSEKIVNDLYIKIENYIKT